MHLSVTFRHMETTEALKDYAKEKVDRITKYFPDPIKAHVVLACERGYQHTAEVIITLRNGILIKGAEKTEDMYSSIDSAMAKIERQVRRYKEKIKSHRGGTAGDIEIQHSVVNFGADGASTGAGASASGGGDSRGASPGGAGATGAHPTIIRKSKFFARPLTTEEAAMQMNLLGNSFLVFTNADTREVNVIYRREDDTYGLIETGAAHQPGATTGKGASSGAAGHHA